MRAHFESIDEKFKQLLSSEKIDVDDSFFDKILRFLSFACHYEEEEVKIKPNVFITKNLHKHKITNAFILPVEKEEGCIGEKCDKRMKSLLPFCNLGWSVYIDVSETHLEYGLIRLFSGPRGGAILQAFSNISDPNESSMVEISVISGHEIMINGMNENHLCIDFRLFKDEKENTVDDIHHSIAHDISAVYSDVYKQSAVDLLIKLFRLARQKVHGTIVLVVDESFQFPNPYLTDGTWLEQPIDLIETGLIALGDSGDMYTTEKYYGLSGLFVEMMNVDGITIIDNAGRVRGYNVFINQSTVKSSTVSGGARKRAKMALLNTKDPSIIGVYFQSQDGHISYERMAQE